MFEQIRYLSARHDVYLLSFMRDWEESGLENLKSICKEVRIVRIREKKAKSYSFVSPGFIKNYYSKKMNLLIQRKIKEVDFDLVQFEYLPMAQYRNGLKVKTILTEHQLGFLCLKKEMELERDFFKKILLFFRYNRLLRYETNILKKFDRVVFISSHEARYIKDANVFISPMGIDTEYFKPGNNAAEDIDLIYIANFDSYQNEDSMIYFSKYIWPLIKKKRPRATFKIIGYNSKKKLGFLEKEDDMEILGYVDDIRDYINKAKVFILPARLGGGMRGKLLEALSMGKSAVSTSIGIEGYRGDILKAISVADNPEDFTDKTIELLNNEELRKNMGYIARKAIEKEYKWESIFSNMDRLYERLCEK